MTRAAPLALAVAVLAAGCSAPPPAAPDTGAKAAARDFFTAVRVKDWPAAYALVHPDTRKSVTAAEFARRAAAYRVRLGFDPTAVRVPVCEEHGGEATAHVELTGRGHGARRFQDAVSVKSTPAGWRVVPPDQFGR